MPLFRGATSKAILAFLPDHRQKRLYLNNEQLIMESALGGTWKEYKASLRQIRRQGYAASVAEVDAGVFGIAAPVFSPEGKVIGSISNVRPVSRLDKAKWTQEGRSLTETAKRISERIAAFVGNTILHA